MSTASSPQSRKFGLRHSHMRISLCLTFVIAAYACGSPYPAVQKILDATVPAGDPVPPLPDRVRENISFRFVWDFDTHLTDAAYLETTVQRLTYDGFSTNQRTPSSVSMTRLDGGDAYRLTLEVVTPSPTRVRATLVISPG